MANPLSETLTRQVRMLDGIARRNLDGITHEDSLVRAVPDGTHINWIVGHVVAIRCVVLPILNQEPVFEEAQAASYRTHLVETSLISPFDEVAQAFYASTDRMIAGLADATDELYALPAPFSPGNDPTETMGTLLTKFSVHEGYHLGQTGILRRVTGKPGAIRGR